MLASPDALDVGHQRLVAPARWQRVPGCAAWLHGAGTRRGDLQDLADRLDPKGITVLVDERHQDFSRRSSSAWAKNALAKLQNLVGLAQFLDLALQILDALRSSRW
jgi:hypothetical protein